jgi:hypothetical protein
MRPLTLCFEEVGWFRASLEDVSPVGKPYEPESMFDLLLPAN